MRKLLFSILMLLVCASMVLAEDITISAGVDRTEIEFGDQIQLTVNIKKALTSQNTQSFSNNGFSFSFNSFNMSSMNDIDFRVENIPDFDIMGRSSSQQSRSINGKGESVKQIILTLVPQKVGELTIPAFSMKDKDGEEHHSDQIKIKVNQAAEDPDEDENVITAQDNEGEENINESQQNGPASSQPMHSKPQPKESNWFNTLLYAGIAIILFVILIIVFAIVAGKKTDKPDTDKVDNAKIEDAVIVKQEEPAKQEEIVKPDVEKVEFETIVASIKIQFKEVSVEFYRKYFELFKKACCYRNQNLSMDMTYDELLDKCSKIAGTDNIKQASTRLAFEIETVMYANRMPNRQLIAIESDIKEILNSL